MRGLLTDHVISGPMRGLLTPPLCTVGWFTKTKKSKPKKYCKKEKNPRKKTKYLENFQHVREKLVEVEARDHLRNWQPPVDGNQLMEWFGLPPGKEIGQIKTAIREAVLDGQIPNTFDDARRLAYDVAASLGIEPKIAL